MSPLKGWKHSEESKRKMSINHPDRKGENHPMYGKHHTDATRQKMSKAGKGRKFSEEHKNKISEALKGRIPWCKGKKRPEHSRRMKGEYNYFYGKTHTDETIAKIRKTMRERDHSKGEKNPNWIGGRRFNYAGYVLIWIPDHPYSDINGYVFEHRLVAEKALGRFLKSNEKVHHINRNKSDNRNCNFLVCSNEYHASLEQKIRRMNGSR